MYYLSQLLYMPKIVTEPLSFGGTERFIRLGVEWSVYMIQFDLKGIWFNEADHTRKAVGRRSSHFSPSIRSNF